MDNKPTHVYAFIDSQNLNLAIQDCGWELDFGRFHIPNPRKYSALLRKFRRYFAYIDALAHKLGKNKERGSNLRTKP